LQNKVQNILKPCALLTITDFTENKVSKYLQCCKLRFCDAEPFAGTNPLLLSLITPYMQLADFTSLVQTTVQNYMQTNLGLVNDNKTLENYFKISS